MKVRVAEVSPPGGTVIVVAASLARAGSRFRLSGNGFTLGLR
ncbi:MULTISPECIES: hypothetical protein [unclassified Crossiella]|nr:MULTISPECIES: hypothetical protein [unclassified Crossiella]